MVDKTLLRRLYEDAASNCSEGKAWEFENAFTECILEEVSDVLAECYRALPIEFAGHVLYIQSQIDDRFYRIHTKNGSSELPQETSRD